MNLQTLLQNLHSMHSITQLYPKGEVTAITKKLTELEIQKDNPDTEARILHALDLLAIAVLRWDNATTALKEIQKRNRLRNDLDAYLYEVVNYGLGNQEKPDPADYGQEG